MDDIQFRQLTGRDGSHLCSVVHGGRSFQLTIAAAAAFQALAEAAAQAGFDLAIASAHRDFKRQLSIWNAKASGRLPVLASNGKPLDIGSLAEREKVFAILRWSALPGASRHHWGSDLDIYDAAAVPQGYQVQLTPEETDGEGVFADLHRWLDRRIDTDDAFGFYRPYRVDRGGVAPEPWHLSFAPESYRFQQQLEPGRFYDFLSTQGLAMGQTVLGHFEEIYHRFIEPEAGSVPAVLGSCISGEN